MLVVDPEMRISIKDIKKHKFFIGIDWKKAKNRQLEPYYIPEVSGKFDISHFK